ncbi:hypothetical protein BDQ12DRAFT_3050 [Crucibulum laeve]|uniref:Uncharacterized protein n=1 Tax=Crucibulum laeve TaxID=68775 RepID=A0A5C3MFA9_9AGAR|nr:hypothetical protein BDQ12DRAFT_3050 [Crucibulum laeve]
MAILNVADINARRLSAKVIGIATVFTILLVLYTFSSPSALSFFSSPRYSQPTCSPKAYSNGSWAFRLRTEATALSNKDDVLAFAGFEGCASSREYYWHLAADNEEQYDRFPGATSYEWIPGQECAGLRVLDPANVVRDLVEEGGWLLVGDSVTENHFFSLSCLLYPHVIATPNYTANPYFDRAWPQHLYLNPASPLVPRLSLPYGFNITSTPLVTFRRIDLLLSQEEIITVHAKMNPSNSSLFSDEAVWTLPVTEYLDVFTAPLPTANYATMVVSTAGHWTATLFSGLRDESEKDEGYGIRGVIALFNEAMTHWANEVQERLWKEARGLGVAKGDRTKGNRQVVVRAYLPGHEDCHSYREPWKEVQPFVWNWYNWGNIWEYNQVFERLLSARGKFPNIHYLDIYRPARLRPDAHTTGDCLHIMTGAGVLEGWTHYIWHYITKELK